MEIQQSITRQSWFEKFSCVGGKCPLTCCVSGKWKIVIESEKISQYKALSDECADEIKEAIDFEKATFKSKEQAFNTQGKKASDCALLTDEGWCKMVLNYGEDMLCETCYVYPRNLFRTNNHFERYVDISCPVVAAYLLDSEPITYELNENVGFILETPSIDENIFSVLMDFKSFLIDLFTNVDGFIPGKCFILFDIANSIQKIIDNGDVGPDSFDALYGKYENNDIIAAILEECEVFGKPSPVKTEMARIAIEFSAKLADVVLNHSNASIPDIKEHINNWKKGIGLEEDMTGFYKYRDENYPDFLSKIFAYRLGIHWLVRDPSEFAMRQKAWYLTILVSEMVWMSAWKSKGEALTAEEISVLIAATERAVHSSQRMMVIAKNIEEVEMKLGYSAFMMPVY